MKGEKIHQKKKKKKPKVEEEIGEMTILERKADKE